MDYLAQKQAKVLGPKNQNTIVSIATPLKAIRAKCLDCSGGSRAGVDACEVTGCPLWPYRLGKLAWKREMSEEEKARRREEFNRRLGRPTEGGGAKS